jgi:hypothetical protein
MFSSLLMLLQNDYLTFERLRDQTETESNKDLVKLFKSAYHFDKF